MISSHNDHDVSRKQSEHIIMLQRVYKCPICKTCSNIHYLIILSFTLIMVAVTRNKIVTKEACSTLFEFFFLIEVIFFISMVWPLETLFLDTMLIFIFQRSCLGQFNFYPQGSPESFANPNLCEPCNQMVLFLKDREEK